MSVCIVNLAELDPESNGGLSRVAKEISTLLLDLSEEQASFHPIFAVGERFASHFPQWMGRPAVVIPVNPQHPDRPLLRGLNPDILVSPLFGIEPFDQISEFKGVRHIAVMPDTLVLDHSELFDSQVRAQRQRSYQRLKSAHHVITLSEYARERLIGYLGLSPTVVTAIHLGADAVTSTGKLSREENVPSPYLFYPANAWPHKRHVLAIQTLKCLLQERPDFHLVLTGGRVAGFGVDLPQLISDAGLPPDRVHHLGYVSEDQLAALYANAEALLFTSVYEGFGMPIVEAMRLKCPVICAPVTAIPEVAGDAALYVDSEKPEDWAAAILNELPKQRAALIERGERRVAQLSWKQTREACRELLVAIAPDVFGVTPTPTVPVVSLSEALQETEMRFSLGKLASHVLPGSSTEIVEVDLATQLAYMETLLLREQQSALGRVPVFGFIVRALIRMRNLGRFYHTSNLVVREIARRQLMLAAQMDSEQQTDADLVSDEFQE